MKYILEIMKEYEDAFKGISVYSVSEEKKLMVDFVAREELEDAQKQVEEAYQKGLDDAWGAARKLFSSMTDSDIEKAFPTEWNNGGFNALMNLQPQEAIAKLKAYEEQKADDAVKRGDVVRNKVNGLTYIVTLASEGGYVLLGSDGNFVTSCITNSFEKTGRRFDIDKILEAMKE